MLIRSFIIGERAEFRQRVEHILDMPDLVVIGFSGKRGLGERLAGETVDLVIAEDSALPRAPARVVRSLRELPEQPDVVVLAAAEDPVRRAALLTAGCTAVLYAGLADQVITRTLAAVLARRRADRSNRRLATMPGDDPSLDDFVSSSPAMRKLVTTARRVAESDTSLLVLGETGAGKERLARAIHAAGPRKHGPFVAINCGAIPEALLESELFGHEKGAFTGAVRSRRGHFELAHRGTFFLDEVGDLPAPLQVKLLRVLQDHTLQPVGSEHTIEVDVRVIAATSQHLEHAIETKRFRPDLYYRLGVVTLTVPPLRERKDDIPLLADAYREHFSARLKRPVGSISRDALRILSAYHWPGNVRELANVMERAVLLCAGEVIQAADLADLARHAHGRSSVPEEVAGLFAPAWIEMPWHEARRQAMDAFEGLYLTRLLEASHGRVGQAAARSGLNPRSLYEKMHKHGLRKDMFRRGPGDSGHQGS